MSRIRDIQRAQVVVHDYGGVEGWNCEIDEEVFWNVEPELPDPQRMRIALCKPGSFVDVGAWVFVDRVNVHYELHPNNENVLIFLEVGGPGNWHAASGGQENSGQELWSNGNGVRIYWAKERAAVSFAAM
jgi:hypothetical protein